MKKMYLLSLLFALIYGTAMATANDIGISQTSGCPLIESMQINIDENPDSIYTVYAYYPHGTSVYSSISWSVSGGLVNVADLPKNMYLVVIKVGGKSFVFKQQIK